MLPKVLLASTFLDVRTVHGGLWSSSPLFCWDSNTFTSYHSVYITFPGLVPSLPAFKGSLDHTMQLRFNEHKKCTGCFDQYSLFEMRIVWAMLETMRDWEGGVSVVLNCRHHIAGGLGACDDWRVGKGWEGLSQSITTLSYIQLEKWSQIPQYLMQSICHQTFT